MPKILIYSIEDADARISTLEETSRKMLEKLAKLSQTNGLSSIRHMKFDKIGCDPLDETKPLNLIEQINQTLTYLVSFKAVKQLLGSHPDSAPFTLNLGTSSGSDIEGEGKRLVAEVFAAVKPSNNGKLKKDIKKVLKEGESAKYKYVFFMSPEFQAGPQKELDEDGVKVFAVEME
jgi:hypothetical protein